MAAVEMDSYVPESGKKTYALSDDDEASYYSGDKPYPEMSKEHLLRHSTKPLWRTLRTISILFIILCWLALLATTIAIIIVHPRCKKTPELTWWQKSTIYRVYIRSFQDSDGDGVGDLKGLSSRLDYLSELGVQAVSISPFYEHDQAENEFSVLNHTSVDSLYGNMADFEELVEALHQKDMQLILDFIPGTTSIGHDWFQRSSASDTQDNEFRNYYVWNENSQIPNNWLSVYSRSGDPQVAWNKQQTRNHWYLHQFLARQPSLNLRNYQVQSQLEDVLRFWLDKGVDGFYIRNSAYLFVDPDLRDESRLPDTTASQDEYDAYNHDRTFALPEVNDMFTRWRFLLNKYPEGNTKKRLLFADIPGGTIEQTLTYYGRYGRDGVDFPLNHNLIPIDGECDGTCVKKHLDQWLNNLPVDKWGTWMVGSENELRVKNRTSLAGARAMSLLYMLLPGTAISYYGDEIGMNQSPVIPTSPWSMGQPMRSPMQWSNSSDAGFGCNCTNTSLPWLAVNDDFEVINVADQENSMTSNLKFYKGLNEVRQNPSVQYGDFRYLITNENLVSFLREFDGQMNVLVAINFGKVSVKQDFRPGEGDVMEATILACTHPRDDFNVGDDITLEDVTIQPGEGVVLSWDYQIKQY